MAVFTAAPRPESLAQGDVLEQVEVFRPRRGGYQDTVWAPGTIASHSCDFTKFRADEDRGRAGLDLFPLLVVPVISMSRIPDAGTAGHARSDRVPRYFHIPPEPPLDSEDHFLDFWFMQPIAVHELLAIRRVASMTDEWQQRLQRGLDRFFSWEDRKRPLGTAQCGFRLCC